MINPLIADSDKLWALVTGKHLPMSFHRLPQTTRNDIRLARHILSNIRADIKTTEEVLNLEAPDRLPVEMPQFFWM